MHLRSRQQSRHSVPQRVEHDALLRDAPDPERAARHSGSAGSHRRQRVRHGRSPASGIAWQGQVDYPVTACLQHLRRSPAYPASLKALTKEGDMLQSSIVRLRLTAATLLIATTPAFAQSTGQVTGVVKDSTGAALPDATVTVTGADGAKHEASTSPDGSYTVSDLPPGNYSVSAAHVGFRTALQQRQAVAAGGTLTVDFTLETNLVTNLTEEITVTAMKREDVVRKVPFSMTATSEETLRMRGATDIEDVE